MRTLKVWMKDNLVERYEKLFPGELREPGNEDIAPFLRSIEGKQVSLVFIDGDAFEENNKSIWLPDDLWESIYS